MRDDEKRPDVPDIGPREDDELSQYGDEQDAPVRRRRPAKASSAKSPRRKRGPRRKKKKKRAHKKRRPFFEWMFSGTPKHPAKRKGTGPVQLFGLRLSFWPVFLVAIAL